MHVSNYTDVLNRTYTYSSTQNDGWIETIVDAVSGETVQFQYDSLMTCRRLERLPHDSAICGKGSPAATLL